MSPYRQLEARFRRIEATEEAIRVLDWDTAAMMPAGGAEARAEQSAVLRRIAHEETSARDLGELLEAAEGEPLDDWQRANLREMGRRWRHASALSAGLVEAVSRTRSECEALWRRARADGDFGLVRNSFERLVALKREVAAAKAERLGVAPYDALLDQYEPGATTALIDGLFRELLGFLPGLIDAVLARQAELPPLAGRFPVVAQRRLATWLMVRIGFDFNHGRLDESAHPFCGGVPDDVRITTRFDESDFGSALMAVLHETGHGLYKRALPEEWRLQPVGLARGMAIHESQSLFLEMQVCRSREFFRFAAPLIREAFGGSGPQWEPESLYQRQVRVRRSLIRVEADEITYPMHVILRYRLERAMIAGELRPAELPIAWREGLQSLLGVAPASDREGCLQDIHWYDGFWGYFPTYTLGALIAAQLFAAARRAMPDLREDIARGDFAPIVGWLGGRVHSKGSLLPTPELVMRATGEPLGTRAFERHLRERYLV